MKNFIIAFLLFFSAGAFARCTPDLDAFAKVQIESLQIQDYECEDPFLVAVPAFAIQKHVHDPGPQDACKPPAITTVKKSGKAKVYDDAKWPGKNSKVRWCI
jgi:hypothetical protein